MTLNYWDCDKGTIASLVYRQWAIEPFAVIRHGHGVLFASADKAEALAWGDTFAGRVCAALDGKA